MTLWAITSYFNPVGYRTRLENYRQFRAALGGPLLTVEHNVDGRFDLTAADADVLCQLQGGAVLWQKERLLNVALQELPADCTAVAWLDCDVILTAPDWPSRAMTALERYPLLQPFSRAHEVGGPAEADRYRPSFGLLHGAGRLTEEHLATWRIGTEPVPIHCGYAWVARLEVLRRHGFYDVSVVGGGTRELATTALNRIDRLVACRPRNRYQLDHLMAWAVPFGNEVAGRVGWIDGDLEHLWHGSVADRGYGTRYQAVASLGFDPATDLVVADGCWQWATDKPELHRYVAEYFNSRREDG